MLKLGGASLASLTGIGVLSSAGSAEYVPPEELPEDGDYWERWMRGKTKWDSDTSLYNEFQASLDATLTYNGAQRLEEAGNGEWIHGFNAACSFHVEGKGKDESYWDYEPVDHVWRLTTKIESNDTDKQWLATSRFNSDVGITPEPSNGNSNGGANYGEAAVQVLSLLVNSVDYLETAYSVKEALKPDQNKKRSTDDIEYFDWRYHHDEPSEATALIQFFVVNNDDHSVADFDITFGAGTTEESVINFFPCCSDVSVSVSVDAEDYQ